jgi:5'-3' exoribonuclease 1
LIDFYPTDFDTDLNGKQQDWEAVVLIPFIDEVCTAICSTHHLQKRLLAAMAERDSRLTAEERRRNTHGPHLLYRFESAEPNTTAAYKSHNAAFGDIRNNRAVYVSVQ